jgi:uncharacterized protein
MDDEKKVNDFFKVDKVKILSIVKEITQEQLQDVAGTTGFNQTLITKDYYVTLVVYLLRDIDGIYFKGGTALQKIFLNYSRLSEDADYTITKDVNNLQREIEKIIKESGYFENITKDKHVRDFIRLVVHYKDPFGEAGTVFIDLNKRAKLILKPETHDLPHFYPENIPKFKVNLLNLKEMVAEKMAATVGRNKPRDHFDLYKIISKKIPLDLNMIKKKCEASGDEFSIIKMFNRAKKLKNKWDQDMAALVAEEITFQEVMKTLAKHFKLKQEKEKLKNDTQT